jgi:hypothetical protein
MQNCIPTTLAVPAFLPPLPRPPAAISLSVFASQSVSPPLCLSVSLSLTLPVSVSRLLSLPPALDSS